MEKLKVEYKNIDVLIPYENNPRINDEAVEYVAKSIKEYGFKVPIIVDKNNIIVAGHTRYKASKELGLKEVPCIVANDLTDEQIKAFRLADNKVSDYSIWDNTALLEELQDLEGTDLFTGFDFSETFEDILDESDTSILGDGGEQIYKIIVKSTNKNEIDMVRQYCEDNNIGYE